MVTRTITLRPNADISVGHSLSAGSSGYSLISEATADNDSTYIYQTLSNAENSSSLTSTFRLSGTMPTDPYTISAVRLYAKGRKSTAGETASFEVYFGINTTSVSSNSNRGIIVNSSSIGSSWSSSPTSASSSALVTDINNYLNANNGAFPTVSVKVVTTGQKSSTKNASNGYVRITQIYMEVDCEVDTGQHIFIKENGNWVEYSKVFVKQNGVWVEQADLPSVFDTNTMYLKKT